MLTIPTYLATSSIHGVGLFTAVDISAGQLVWYFNDLFDRFMTDEQFAQLPSHIQRYIEIHGFKDVNSNIWILDGGNDLHVNHSDDPNVIEDGELVGCITKNLYASRDISAGEELTQNYLEFCQVAKLKLDTP